MILFGELNLKGELKGVFKQKKSPVPLWDKMEAENDPDVYISKRTLSSPAEPAKTSIHLGVSTEQDGITMVSSTSWRGRPISELSPERINEFLFQQRSPTPLKKRRTGGDMGQLCHLTFTCLDLQSQDSCFISLLGVLLKSLTLGPRHRGRSAGRSWTETHGWDCRGA